MAKRAGAALHDSEHPFGVDARYPGHGSGDIGGKPGGFGVWMAFAHPTADEDWTRRRAIGVDALGGQFVENDVDIGTGHMIDRRVNARDLSGQSVLESAVSVALFVVQV